MGAFVNRGGGLNPHAKWVVPALMVVLLILAVQPASAIPQSDSATITLPARPIRSDNNNAALSLPVRPAERLSVAYAPEATPAVMTISAPAPVAERSIAYDPTGPSSLALLAIGLGLALWVVRSRRWVR